MSLFCEHKKLRTTCPDCRQAAQAETAAQRAEQPVRRVESGREPSRPQAAGRAAAEANAAAGGGEREEPKEGRKKSGQLLPKRTRQRSPTSRAEAEQAEAWWVKK